MDGKPVPIKPHYALEAGPQVSSGVSLPRPVLLPTKKLVPGTSANPITTTGAAAAGEGEQFAIDMRVEHEARTTGDEAHKAMRDLLSGAVGAIDISGVDMNDAVVDGFDDGFRLMPHQIQGRAWMKERETGKKTGGILADVGIVLHCGLAMFNFCIL